MRALFRFFLLLGLPLAALSQSNLPACPASGFFDNCQGTYAWPNGNKYVGEWRNDKLNGRGSYSWPDGTRYVGTYQDGKRHGQGTYTWPNGNRYTGDFQNDKRTGRGTLTLPSGNQYVGEFEDGEFNGQGIYTWPDGERYAGDFKGGDFHGRGVWTTATAQYVGEVRSDKRNGEGIEYGKDGSVRRAGTWRDGQLVTAHAVATARFPFASATNAQQAGSQQLPPCPASGLFDNCQGPYTWSNGNKYVGEWRNNKRHGRGTFTFPSGDQYVGEYQDDRRQGRGTYTWPNANKYVGDFQNDKRTGRGIYTWPNGNRYVGDFVDGELTGQGTITYADGEHYAGEFRGGRRNGEGIEYGKDLSVRRSGNWKDDQLAASYAINTARFPVLAAATASTTNADAGRAERERLTAEVETERKRRQELEERLANELKARERLVAEARDRDRTQGAQQAAPAASRNARRIALVIGNSTYKISPLENPANDAMDIAESLKKLGFRTTLIRNATLAQMREATRQFTDQLPSSDVALIYFAGHGVESNRKNYMIPVNADLKFEYELADQAYDAGIWLDMLEGVKSNNAERVNIVILDACRNNALIGARSLGRGLGRMDAPTGTFLAFSTGPGKVAADGARGERNSPFTKHLLRALQKPGTPIEEVFKEVRRNVSKETNGAQVPWESTSLTGFFTFQ